MVVPLWDGYEAHRWLGACWAHSPPALLTHCSVPLPAAPPLCWIDTQPTDMHPGNILVREVDRSGGIAERFALLLKQLSAGLPLPGVREVFRNVVLPPTPQLVLLDTGMIAELSKADQRSVVEFFKVGVGVIWIASGVLKGGAERAKGGGVGGSGRRLCCRWPDWTCS